MRADIVNEIIVTKDILFFIGVLIVIFASTIIFTSCMVKLRSRITNFSLCSLASMVISLIAAFIICFSISCIALYDINKQIDSSFNEQVELINETIGDKEIVDIESELGFSSTYKTMTIEYKDEEDNSHFLQVVFNTDNYTERISYDDSYHILASPVNDTDTSKDNVIKSIVVLIPSSDIKKSN